MVRSVSRIGDVTSRGLAASGRRSPTGLPSVLVGIGAGIRAPNLDETGALQSRRLISWPQGLARGTDSWFDIQTSVSRPATSVAAYLRVTKENLPWN